MMSNAAVYLANYIDSFSTGSSRGHTRHSPTREADTEDLGNKVSFGKGDPQSEDDVAAAKMLMMILLRKEMFYLFLNLVFLGE